MSNSKVDESDYFRVVLRHPERFGDVGARLVQTKLIAHLLDSLQRHTPRTVVGLCGLDGARQMILSYGEEGYYEGAYEQAQPHAIQFVRYLLGCDVPAWCKDLARVELWQSFLRLESEERSVAQAICRAIDHKAGMSYMVVESDVPAAIQSVDGYLSTTISGAARLLWLLGFEPVKLLVEVPRRPGIVVFEPREDVGAPAVRYLAGDA
jgi:hypothetical protein